jgi:restriction system protein
MLDNSRVFHAKSSQSTGLNQFAVKLNSSRLCYLFPVSFERVWEQLQELVAEILRAMGFRAETSEKGPDRGVDVIASPDGLGLKEPRIFVEVKHRKGTRISADQIRAFIGGRQQGDKCLYVSTGGYTKEARYEAERSSIPLTLVDLPRLRALVLEHYDSFSPEGLALVPLKRVYWPIG